MTKDEFSHKLRRWLDFAKANRVKKYDAWPIWLQILRYFGQDIKPLFFWENKSIYCYYASVFFFTFVFLTQYFTGHFIWGQGVWHYDNLLITLLMAQPMAFLMTFNIVIKKRRLNLPDWEHF